MFKLFAFLIESGEKFLMEEPIKEIVFCPMFVLRKRIFKFRKDISCAYPKMCGKSKNFIQISVIGKNEKG